MMFMTKRKKLLEDFYLNLATSLLQSIYFTRHGVHTKDVAIACQLVGSLLWLETSLDLSHKGRLKLAHELILSIPFSTF